MGGRAEVSYLTLSGLGQEQPMGTPTGQSRTPGGELSLSGLTSRERKACEWAIEMTRLHNLADTSYAGWVPGKKLGTDTGDPQTACEAALTKLHRQQAFDNLILQSEQKVKSHIASLSNSPAETVFAVRAYIDQDGRNDYDAALAGRVYAVAPRTPWLPKLKKVFPIFNESPQSIWIWEFAMPILFPHTPTTKCFNGFPRTHGSVGVDRSYGPSGASTLGTSFYYGQPHFSAKWGGMNTYVGDEKAPQNTDPIAGQRVPGNDFDGWLKDLKGETPRTTLGSLPGNTSDCHWATGGGYDYLLEPEPTAYLPPAQTAGRLLILGSLKKEGILDLINTRRIPGAFELFKNLFFDPNYSDNAVIFYARRLAMMTEVANSIPWPMHDYGRIDDKGKSDFYRHSFWFDFLVNAPTGKYVPNRGEGEFREGKFGPAEAYPEALLWGGKTPVSHFTADLVLSDYPTWNHADLKRTIAHFFRTNELNMNSYFAVRVQGWGKQLEADIEDAKEKAKTGFFGLIREALKGIAKLPFVGGTLVSIASFVFDIYAIEKIEIRGEVSKMQGVFGLLGMTPDDLIPLREWIQSLVTVPPSAPPTPETDLGTGRYSVFINGNITSRSDNQEAAIAAAEPLIKIGDRLEIKDEDTDKLVGMFIREPKGIVAVPYNTQARIQSLGPKVMQKLLGRQLQMKDLIWLAAIPVGALLVRKVV